MDPLMAHKLLAGRLKALHQYNEMLQALHLAREIGEEDDIRQAETDLRKAKHQALEFATKAEADAIDNTEYVGV